MYKSQLQEHAQKCGWTVPQYESSKAGPPHLLRFQASVEVNGVKYDSDKSKRFSNLKAAEHSAAKTALDALTGGAPDSSLSGLCKNVLQEHAQRNGLPLPLYQLETIVESKGLIQFVATVEIDGVFYKGGAAKNKKEAEVKAARTAVLAIKGTGDAAPPPEEYIPLQSGKKRVRAAKNEEESPRSKARA